MSSNPLRQAVVDRRNLDLALQNPEAPSDVSQRLVALYHFGGLQVRHVGHLYPGLSPEFAFAVGGEVTPCEMGAEHLAVLARQLGMQPRFLAQQARNTADRVPPTAIDQPTRDVAPSLTAPARTLAERLECFVSSTIQKLVARITAAP